MVDDKGEMDCVPVGDALMRFARVIGLCVTIRLRVTYACKKPYGCLSDSFLCEQYVLKKSSSVSLAIALSRSKMAMEQR